MEFECEADWDKLKDILNNAPKLDEYIEYKGKKYIKEEYCIPKSKVTEKIEKLAKEFNFYAGREHAEWQDGEFDGEMCDDIALQIKVLKELLEECK